MIRFQELILVIFYNWGFIIVGAQRLPGAAVSGSESYVLLAIILNADAGSKKKGRCPRPALIRRHAASINVEGHLEITLSRSAKAVMMMPTSLPI
jgi:hypothetical protein